MTGLDELIGLLEKATGPDSLLEAEIFTAVFGDVPFWAGFHGCVTSSIDDAFALAPPEMVDWLLSTQDNTVIAEITVKTKRKKTYRKDYFRGQGPNGAIALSLACLRARAPAQPETKDL